MTRIRVRRIPPRNGLSECYVAEFSIPVEYGVGDTDGAVITVGAVGWSFRSAFKKATSFAKRIAKDPIINSMMPPQAKAAIAAARKLSAAAQRGRKVLNATWKRLPPSLRKRTKRLATSMMRRIAPAPMPRMMPAARPMPGPMQYDEAPAPEYTPGQWPPPETAPVEPNPAEAYTDDGYGYDDGYDDGGGYYEES